MKRGWFCQLRAIGRVGINMISTKNKHCLMNDKKLTYGLFVLPGFAMYCCFFMLPIVLGIYYSMTDWNGISPTYNFTGLTNYIKIFADKGFRKVLGFNIKYTVLLVIGTICLGIFLALLLNSRIKGRSIFRTLYFFPAVLSMLTVSLIFNQIFYRIIPVLGAAIGSKTFSSNILANKNLAMYGILFVHIWQGVALPTLLFLAGLQTIPEELYEAASLDGANVIQKFRYITISYLLPTLSVVLVLTLKSGLMVFDYIKSLTEGGPGGATQSIALMIYNHGFVQNKYSYSIAEAIVTGVIIAGVSAIQIKFTERKKVQ